MMYVPPAFRQDDIEQLHALIASHPLGTVVTHGAGGLDAVHLPFEIAAPAPGAPFGVLRAHVARANPIWQRGGEAVLAIFQGPSAYISPSHYENKALNGRVVPTYNYATVHAHGKLRTVDDPAWLLPLLERLTGRHESARPMPWKVADAPRDYIDKLLAAIVGIEIPIERLDGAWKLSQNRIAKDQQSIADEMAGSGATAAMADLMRVPAAGLA
jgi:transcriptional regulator